MKGAIDFARDKPIYFADISDLVAMQDSVAMRVCNPDSSPVRMNAKT
jgi:hypothetical protein